ncbi:MAG: GLUG motif-containing protein, partial [Planctomycetota bacterium]
TYTSTEALNVGLFGYLKSRAVIKDLGLIDPNVYTGADEMGGWGVGSLVGLIGDGAIMSCYVEGGSVAGGWMVGSLVGYVEDGTITDCYVEGSSVLGDEDAGGLVGFNQGTITNCYAIGDVSCNSGGGGLVGNSWAGEITNCYSAGSVTGNEWVGGLVGFNLGTINTCYSVGSVTANDIFGGLVGDNSGEIMDSFWDVEASGQATSSGGMGKTTAEMQTRSTFTNAGWDFVGEMANGPDDIWWILEGQDYPRLWWETSSD